MKFLTKLLGGAGEYLSGFTFKFWLALIAVLLACIPLAYCQGRSDGKALVEARNDRATAKSVTKAREADEDANTQRQADTERNRDAEDQRNEAARTGGRDAVNCERLQSAYPGRSFPACD